MTSYIPAIPGPVTRPLSASPLTSGPLFLQATGPVRARIPARTPRGGVYMGTAPGDTSFGTGQIQWNSGTPVSNPAPVPFFPPRQAVRAKLPYQQGQTLYAAGGVYGSTAPGADVSFGTGRTMWSSGAPVRNPTPGPVFRQKPQPVQYVLPPPHPRAGRIGSSFGAPVENPVHGPPVYPLQGPAVARFPQLHPRAGRVEFNSGAPVRNPAPGPVFAQKPFPVQARYPLPPRGRVYSPALQKIIPPSSGPVFIQADQALRAKLPQQPLLRGRVASNSGAPVHNPAPGPRVYALQGPVRVRLPSFSPVRGRLLQPRSPAAQPHPGTRIPASGAGSAGKTASSATSPRQGQLQLRGTSSQPRPGAAFYQAVQPIRARIPQIFSKGRISSNAGAPVHNPAPGPVFRQATTPARIRLTLPPRGRTGSNPGVPSRRRRPWSPVLPVQVPR